MRGLGFYQAFAAALFATISVVLFFRTSHASNMLVDANHRSCETCHRMPESLISDNNLFPPGIDPSTICLDCHHYHENHHPVNFVPQAADPDGVSLNSFPLFNGEVRCLTCHDPHADSGKAGRPKLLRGGPYASRTEICFKCHDTDLNTRVDPHLMFDESGRIKRADGQPVCLLCHAFVPDLKKDKDKVKVTFKADIAFLCWRCHPPMGGQFFDNHFLVKPSAATRSHMKKASRQTGVVFPLLTRDRITCSTCHNPHQQGVMPYGPARDGADSHDRLRLPPETICSGCHPIQ